MRHILPILAPLGVLLGCLQPAVRSDAPVGTTGASAVAALPPQAEILDPALLPENELVLHDANVNMADKPGSALPRESAIGMKQDQARQPVISDAVETGRREGGKPSFLRSPLEKSVARTTPPPVSPDLEKELPAAAKADTPATVSSRQPPAESVTVDPVKIEPTVPEPAKSEAVQTEPGRIAGIEPGAIHLDSPQVLPGDPRTVELDPDVRTAVPDEQVALLDQEEEEPERLEPVANVWSEDETDSGLDDVPEEELTAWEDSDKLGETVPTENPAEPVIPPDARFQVQIMSSSDPEQAEDMRMQALLVFPGELVEVVWDPPNYKVRVGALVNMDSANELKRQALRLGFNNAWVVPRRSQ